MNPVATNLLSLCILGLVTSSVVANSCWSCDDGCLYCDTIVDDPENADYKIATIVITCKGEETISWACCTALDGVPGECEVSGCGQGARDGDYKCEGVTNFNVRVPDGAKNVTINTHDGQTRGNADMNNELCGGNGNQPGGATCSEEGNTFHCEIDIDLATCGVGGGGDDPGCPAEAIEACQGDFCAPKAYNYASCQCEDQEFTPDGTECETEDVLNCAAARVCDGGTCQQAQPLPEGTTCGSADPNLPCDADDKCSGTSLGCPDAVKPSSQVCREATDSCDIADLCDGASKDCPCDETRDLGYTFKCSTTQFLCGPKSDEIVQKNGNSFNFGSCGIGTKQGDFVILEHPECLTQPLEVDCPEVDGKVHGLSNWALGTCVPGGSVDSPATWDCTDKVDVSATTPLPHAPYPDYIDPCPNGGSGGSGGGSCSGTCDAVCNDNGSWELSSTCGDGRRNLQEKAVPHLLRSS